MTPEELIKNALEYERKSLEGERFLIGRRPALLMSIEMYKRLVEVGLIEADDTLPF